MNAPLGLASNVGRRRAAALAALLCCAACLENKPPAPPAPAPSPPSSPRSPPPRGTEISLVYTSNLLATYAPCPCVIPLGGLSRRATAVARARTEADATIVVDAGDLLLAARERRDGAEAAPPGRGPAVSETIRARLVARAIGPLDAFTPGERDLALPLPELRRIAREARLPIVSANLFGADGRLLFDADRLIDAAGVKVGIFGVSQPASADDANRWRAAGIEAREPAEAARAAVRSLRARGATLLVALVHVGGPAESRRVLAAVDGVDWAVLGHSGLNLEIPERVGGARMLEAMSEGRSLGRLDLHLVPGGAAFADRHERDELEGILTDHRRQLTEYDRSLGDIDPASVEAYRTNRRREIEKAIARETDLIARLPPTITGNWFENRVLPLDASVPNDPEVAALVAAYERARPRAPGRPPRP